MRLKESTLIDLRRQAEALQEERKGLHQRLAAIDVDLKAAQTILKSTVSEDLQTRADWIRHALKALDAAATAKQVTAEMVAQGFETDDPENLWKGVAVELNRMSNSDDDPVIWVERGKYRFNGDKESASESDAGRT